MATVTPTRTLRLAGDGETVGPQGRLSLKTRILPHNVPESFLTMGRSRSNRVSRAQTRTSQEARDGGDCSRTSVVQLLASVAEVQGDAGCWRPCFTGAEPGDLGRKDTPELTAPVNTPAAGQRAGRFGKPFRALEFCNSCLI